MRPTKRFWICSLLGLNLLFGAGLLISTIPMNGAYAQAGRGGGDYLAVTAKAAGKNFDVLYLLDLSNQRLHAFYPGLPQKNEILRSEARDVKKDFGKS